MHDYTNAEWLAALRGADPDAALHRLRAHLVRGLRQALIQKYDVTEADVEDFAQEALVKILNALSSFRGESRFTTWAQKIAVRTALTELRRRRWRDVNLHDLMPSVEHEDDILGMLAPPTALSPEQHTAQNQARALLQHLIANKLTERQRLAMSAVMGGGMSLEEVARRMDTNRNALYKLLHDARLRLKIALIERGFTFQELLSIFEQE